MDRDIIINVLNGNKEEYNKLIDKYYNEIFVFSYNQFNDVEVGKDVTQEIFIKVYQKLHKYNSEKASFRTWLYRISSNYCLNYRRDHFKHQMVDFDINLLSSNEDILDTLIQNEDVNIVIDVMKKILSKKHYEIMILRFFSDLTLEEIAESMNVKKKTVSNVVTLSIKKIREEIGVKING